MKKISLKALFTMTLSITIITATALTTTANAISPVTAWNTVWSQHFDTDSRGLSALPDHMSVGNDQLVIMPTSVAGYANTLGSRTYNADTYVIFRGEVTIDHWNEEGRVDLGASNASNTHSHFAWFVDGEVYAAWGTGNIEEWDSTKLGKAKRGKTYVVELELAPGKSTLYVYEKKDENRTEGYQHIRTDQADWGEARLSIGTNNYSVDGRVDNLSESTSADSIELSESIQDFSVDSEGLGALPDHMAVENGQLVIGPAPTTDYIDVLGDRAYGANTHVILRADVTVDQWVGNDEMGFGARNTSNTHSHFASFVNESVYAVWGKGKVDKWKWKKLGSVESGKIYVVELELAPGKTTLYVYEKDTQDRTTGYQHVRTDRNDWGQARALIETWGGLFARVDNFSEITITDITGWTYWAQDFSLDSEGLGALPDHMAVENGQLVISPSLIKEYADTLGDRAYGTSIYYTTLRGEMMVDQWARNNEVGFGARNTSNTHSHFASFVNESVYAVWGKGKVDKWKWKKLGSVESGKIYVVELELAPGKTTLYVYEKDTQDRTTGYQHVRTDRAEWDQARTLIETWEYGLDAQVDSLSETRHLPTFVTLETGMPTVFDPFVNVDNTHTLTVTEIIDPASGAVTALTTAGDNAVLLTGTTVTLQVDGQLSIVAAHDGQESFYYRLTDIGDSSSAVKTVIFTAVDELPIIVDELSARIIANPVTGVSPLTVRFSSDVQNNNLVITGYAWDFDGDGVTDRSDSFGAPQTYTYTGNPGDSFDATLTLSISGNDEPLVATQTITIENEPPVAQVATNVTNGHAPLAVTFTVTAQDPQGIGDVSIDYEGDGTFDETQSGGTTATFQTTYPNQGTYVAVVRITDTVGAETIITNNAITVDVNDPLDPIIQLSATSVSGNVPLTGTLTATVEIFDSSAIAQWRWDLDGNGEFETQGGSGATDTVNFTYNNLNNFYPVAEVTTDSGRTAIASLRIQAQSSALPSLNIPDSSDTITSDNNEIATFKVTIPFETELTVWLENASGGRVKTLQAPVVTTAGEYDFTWDATDDQNNIVSAGDYYVVLGYTAFGQQQEIDLRTTTGGRLSYYRRTEANPRTFDRVQAPLRINYAVDNPAEVSFFWQISFGARLMTLLEREPSGRGQYSLYWNAAFPNGQKIPNNLQTLMPGIVRYDLADNVLFVKEIPRIENFTLNSTVIWDPRREPIGLQLTISKTSTIEMVVADMDRGVDVATRVFNDVEAGEQQLFWDGKNNDDQYLAPGDYRIGVRSVDSSGSRSLYWFRTQQIGY